MAVMSAFHGHLKKHSRHAKARLRYSEAVRTFKEFDADGDGYLTPRQLGDAFSSIQFDVAKPEVELFGMFMRVVMAVRRPPRAPPLPVRHAWRLTIAST